MKFSLKTIAAAAVMAVAAASANATIDNGAGGNGELFLNLTSSAGSYTRDLGYSIDSFQAAVNGAGNINLSWSADALLTSWLGAEKQAGRVVEMNLFAVDANGARRMITTFTDPKPVTTKSSTSIRDAITQVQIFLSNVNPSLSTADSASFVAGSLGYAGQTKASMTGVFNDTVFNYLNFETTKAMSVGNKLDLMMIGAASLNAPASTYTRTMDGANAVQAYFTADNTFVIAAVPEPSEYALMLAGLGMIGFMARRRSNRA